MEENNRQPEVRLEVREGGCPAWPRIFSHRTRVFCLMRKLCIQFLRDEAVLRGVSLKESGNGLCAQATLRKARPKTGVQYYIEIPHCQEGGGFSGWR